MENDNSVAGLKIAHTRAHRGNHAGSLVSKNARRGMRAGGDFLQIGAADSAGMHPHQQFAGADLGNGNRFQANVVHAAIHRRQHGGRNRLLVVFDRELSGNGHSKLVW